MPVIRPFQAWRYSRGLGLDYSNLIAPPYDVLDEAKKAALVDKNEFNIVGVDLPHLPPKTVGPDAVYTDANVRFRSWVKDGILEQDLRAALYPYEQTYTLRNRKFHRRGFFCLVELSDFELGHVVPHERTYDAPIEDRMKLMKATGLQMSPIFGLFHDPTNEVTKELFANVGKPDISAEMDGVKNDLWTVFDARVETKVIDLMKGRPVYIADGHHRYTTALRYRRVLEEAHGGTLPPNHPANYCMFCLISIQDEGLQVNATHRVIAGLTGFDMKTFTQAIGDHFVVREATCPADEHLMLRLPQRGFGVIDGTSKKCYILQPKGTDPLMQTHAERSPGWRKLDVAVLQHYLVEQVLQPKFNGGNEVTKLYTPDVAEAAKMVETGKGQLALIVKPTPLNALVELGKTQEVMPQKSTYFYPKLATGMVMAPLV